MKLVKSQKARTTKTIIELWDLGNSQDSKENGGRWQTICVEHGNCVCHDKKANAIYYMSHPENWCEDCQN